MTLLSMDELQQQVADMEQRRGFEKDSIRDKCLLLGEEVGELYKVVRRLEGIAIDSDSQQGSIQEELADILVVVCTIANRVDVSLGRALSAKVARDDERSWLFGIPGDGSN